MSDQIVTHPGNAVPKAFTQAQLDWLPWLEPPAEDGLSADQLDALIDRARAKSAYFRLLASDPAILKARTLTDKDIFYNPDAGLPRAERELAAAAVSRVNGCIYCASVHARFATTYSKRGEDVDSLLAEGVSANLDDRWTTIVATSVALTHSPVAFGQQEIVALRAAGFDDLAISDAIHAAAFFNWANRLMLTLGEPAVPPIT
jgi:alkylhydroperoxidase domain protein